MTTEQKKMANGLLYNAEDPQLLAQRTHCKEQCFRLNQLPPSATDAQTEIIRSLFGAVGHSFAITAPFYCDYGYNITIGTNFYTNHNCVILDCGKVTFGDNVFIAPGCCFSTAGHPIDADQRGQGLEFAYPITVGSNVWFGANCVVLPGVSIGDGTVIGAGSVVTRDIPPGVIAVGNPCKVLRKITPEDALKYQHP